MAARWDLEIDAGASFSFIFDYQDENGNPVNLTGYTASAAFRQDPRSAGSADLTVTPTITALTGRVTLTLTPTQTGGLTAPRYAYAVEITNGATNVIRLVEGTAKVNPEVVR